MIINTIKRIINILGVIVILSAMPSFVWAECPVLLTVQGPDKITIDPSIPVGSTLWTSTLPSDAKETTCDTGSYTIYFNGTDPYKNNNVYFTSIPGVGIKMRMTVPKVCTTSWWPSSCYNSNWATGVVQFNLEIELIKIGNITTSGTLSGIFANWTTSKGQTILNIVWGGGGVQVTPTTPTCSPVTNSIRVPLGTVSSSMFGGVGTFSPAEAFNLTLNCSGGQEGGTTDIYVTLSDQANPGNRTDTLPLTSGSTARGLGIQILNNGTPVRFGPPSAGIGAEYQWLAGTTGNGIFTVPLAARYIKTETSLVPGSANGVAVFTIDYK